MSEQVWSVVLAAIPSVEEWNRNLGEFKRLTEQYGPECRAYIQTEAERRGYLWSKESRCYAHPWRMVACNHPGRLLGVGWRSGQLAAVFTSKNGPVRYESEGVMYRQRPRRNWSIHYTRTRSTRN